MTFDDPAGYDSLKHLSRIALPFKILILSFVLVLLGTHSDPNYAPSQVFHYAGKPEAGWLLFVTWMNVVAAGSLTMVTDSADFCRYTRSRVDMWWGTLLGKVGGGCFAACIGAYGAAATLGKSANVFEVASGLTTSWFILLLFLIVIALDSWTINVLNLYTGGLSLSNIFERLGRFWTTLIISVLGIILTFAPVSICPVYQHPVDRLGILSAIRGDWGLTSDRDQQIGGLLMWVPMCAIYVTAILAQLARWHSSPQPTQSNA